MPDYRSHSDWQGLQVVTHDADRHRRYLLRWRNYHILDTPEIRVDVTKTADTPADINFDNVQFWQSVQRHTKMYRVIGVSSEELENGRRYIVRGRQVKEREDYRIDISYSEDIQVRKNPEVVFSATVLSRDIKRRDRLAAFWGAVIALILQAVFMGQW